MNIIERISKSRRDYIARYKTEPDVLFIDFYNYSMLQSCDFHYDFEEVIVVQGGDCVRFAEKVDLRVVVDGYNRDNTWKAYEVVKCEMPVSSITDSCIDDRIKLLEPTDFRTIVFSSEEIKAWMRNVWSR